MPREMTTSMNESKEKASNLKFRHKGWIKRRQGCKKGPSETFLVKKRLTNNESIKINSYFSIRKHF